jgi:sugar/nucleoside kinase (ribokinase family)
MLKNLYYSQKKELIEGGISLFDLLVVGHLTLDTIIAKNGSSKSSLGGSPAYASLAAKRLGANVTIISKVGADFPEDYFAWLGRVGIDLTGLRRVPTAPTTRFILRYKNETRVLQLRARCEPILPEDLPRNLTSKGVHVGPVAGEISVGTVRELAKATSIISFDPQGFVRSFDASGFTSDRLHVDPRILRYVTVFKATESELKIAVDSDDAFVATSKVSRLGPQIVIVTKGMEGSIMILKEVRYFIPPGNPQSIVDLTGAGDVFIGGFMAEYVRGEDPMWCAAVGSAAASFKVEGVGPLSLGTKNDVFKRARQILDGIKRL